jgi:CRP-like cAMP-binding protein
MQAILAMNAKVFKHHPIFKGMRHRNRLLSFIGARFKPNMTHAGTKLYQQGDDINMLYIIQKGLGAFIAPSFKNSIFAVIDPSISDAVSDSRGT